MTLKNTGGLRKSMATDETKRKALEGALSATEALVNTFGSVLMGCYTPAKPADHDYSAVVKKILPDAETGAESEVKVTFGAKPDSSLKQDLGAGLSSSTRSDSRPQSPLVSIPEDVRMHMSMQSLITEALSCSRCNLCPTRKNVVFGEGCADRPTVMVIGEGPGEVEDNTGRPFVGPAGQYLDKWLKAIGLDRKTNVYITNIVKCRPPMNRDPLPEEKTACLPFLKQQIALIQPQSILCLGRPASSLMTGKMDAPIGTLRGRFFFFDGIPMMCTYHPAAVLRDLSLKRPVWDDLKKLARYLGIEVAGSK